MNYLNAFYTFASVYAHKAVAARSAQLFLLQLLAAFAVLFGISFWSVPVALIIGGVFAIYSIQSQPDNNAANNVLADKARVLVATLKNGQKLGKGNSVTVDAVTGLLTEDDD